MKITEEEEKSNEYLIGIDVQSKDKETMITLKPFEVKKKVPVKLAIVCDGI
jgi:hypothetical protein